MVFFMGVFHSFHSLFMFFPWFSTANFSCLRFVVLVVLTFDVGFWSCLFVHVCSLLFGELVVCSWDLGCLFVPFSLWCCFVAALIDV